jgi:NAD(P)H-hydrate epimerase
LQQVVEWHSKLLLDADALNLLEQVEPIGSDHPGWPVVTPHPGEAGRLLGVSTAIVNQDRFQAVRQLAELLNGTAVLKGVGSLIASCQSSRGVGVCMAGNPYMATAGMGDVLSGLIGGLAAQGLDPERAAQLGVFLHAAAADYWVAANGRCLIATDIVTALPKVMQDWIDGGAAR